MTINTIVQVSQFCDNTTVTNMCIIDNTIAPGNGNTKCYDCPADHPLASSLHTFCMPADTPKDVITFRAEESISDRFVIPYPVTHYAIELDYYFLPVPGMIVVLNFFNNTPGTPPFTLYASTKTGNPSEENHEYKMHGVNATVGVERTEDAPSTGVFLTVEAPKDKMGVRIGQIISPSKMIQVKPPGTQFKMQHAMMEGYYFFEVSNIDQRSKVSITVSAEGKDPTAMMGLTIYTNTGDRELKYPTEFNYNFSAREFKKQASSVTLVLDNVEAGLLYFSFAPFIEIAEHDVPIKVEIVVQPL
jgi:hypothetical protein